MSRRIRTVALFLAVSLASAGVGQAAQPAKPKKPAPKPVAAVPVSAADAEFVLKNMTKTWLSLFVDGKRTVSVPPGDQGVTLLKPGTHRFRAQTPDGRYVERVGNVPSQGQTWEVTEQ
jgi:hypothetical protein